jgi:outer membrane protein TolC
MTAVPVTLAASGAHGRDRSPSQVTESAPSDAATRAAPSPGPLGAVLHQPGGLTADEVASRATQTSLDVSARRQERAAAEASVDQALAAFSPRLSGVARYTRLGALTPQNLTNLVVTDNQPGENITNLGQLQVQSLSIPLPFNNYLLQGTVQLPLSDYLLRFPKLYAAASGNARAAALIEMATRLKVATEARDGYYRWVRARLQAAVAHQALEQARGHLGDAEHAAGAGRVSRADVLRVESQVAAAELLVARAQHLTALAEDQLRTAMHDHPDRRYEIGEDIGAEVDLSGLAVPASLSAWWDEAAARRLEPQAMREQVGSLHEQAEAARFSGLPRVDAVGNVTYANLNARISPLETNLQGTWDATIQLSWVPTELLSTEAAHRVSQARAAALEAQQAALLDGIRLEVTQAAQALIEAQTASGTNQRGLTAAEESYRVRRALFQNGRATSVELTDAETELVRARLEVIGAAIDLRIARAHLLHALARDAK